MRITLSTVERPDLVAKGAWYVCTLGFEPFYAYIYISAKNFIRYQPPDNRKLSKKAKVRAKKRAKKSERAVNEGGKTTDANVNDDIGA